MSWKKSNNGGINSAPGILENKSFCNSSATSSVATLLPPTEATFYEKLRPLKDKVMGWRSGLLEYMRSKNTPHRNTSNENDFNYSFDKVLLSQTVRSLL
jgi:hypothetical protein